MTEGRAQYDRSRLVLQAQMFVFDGDIQRFIETGTTEKRRRIPHTPEQEALIASIHANGGKLIIPEPKTDGQPQ